MKELQRLLETKANVKFDPEDHRIACYPHIVNICVSHIVSSVAKVTARDLDSDSDGSDLSGEESDDGGYVGEDREASVIDEDEYDLAEWFKLIERDPVKRARAVVRTVRSSGQRRDHFLSIIKKQNDEGGWEFEDGKRLLKELELIKDVRHRWDSLYNMLARMLNLQPVYILF